ncbi:MAG: PAS domain S-box protein [Pyrinomonadaceae bacterium]
MSNLSERKAAEESVRFQAHLLRAVEQSIIATDLDGIVIYWNHFARTLYGWTAQEAIGRHIMELTTPEVMAEQAIEIMSHLRQGESWAGEFNAQRRDGTTFPAQIINSPINNDEGTLIGIIGVSIDIILEHRDHHISLIIEDDGVGFDGAQAFSANDKGLGLIGMRERAALVGGTLEIESHPNNGTTVFIRIPVPREGGHG